MLRWFLAYVLAQATISNGNYFDYFASIDACLEGLPFTHHPQGRYEYEQCKEEEPFCQMFCKMHRGALRVRCDLVWGSASDLRTCYINTNALEYEYEFWTGIYIQEDVPAPESVLEKFKLIPGTTVAEVQRAIFSGVEKTMALCGNWENLTHTTYDEHVACHDLPPEDRKELEHYFGCQEAAWKNCGETL